MRTALGICAGLACAAVLFGCLQFRLTRVDSRVDVPGTPYTVVLTEDWKTMHSYQIFSKDQAVTGVRLLGPKWTEGETQAEITTPQPNVVHIAWTGAGAGKFVTIDLQGQQITAGHQPASIAIA